MNLGQMTTRVRQQIPASGGSGDMADTTIQAALNQGVVKINLITQCYQTYVKVQNIPAVAGTPQMYSLSSICPGFLTMMDSGVWWFQTDGSSQIMYARTRRWLDLYVPNWRDQSPVSSNPTWYWHDGDNLGFYPGSTQQSTNAALDFWVYYLLKPTDMGGPDNYPWTNASTELTALTCMDDAIIAYAVSKLAPAVMDKEGRNYYDLQFRQECQLGAAQLKRQPDLTTAYGYFIDIGPVGGFLPQ